MHVLLGIFFHAIGGFAAGSFYIPFRKVSGWAWECYWIVSGFFSWIIMPWLIALLTVPSLLSILQSAGASDLFWTYFMGALWGIGGLTFGLTMRYLGVSLGMAIALGFCSVFGTLIPPLYDGTFMSFLNDSSGIVMLLGVLVCVAGIAMCGWAGISKEKEMPQEQKQETIKEFNFSKGFLVAIFSGILSACMAFGFAAGRPIAAIAIEKGVDPLWQNSAVLIVILSGGFTTNFIWSLILNIRNKSGRDYVRKDLPLLKNYFFSALAGITWYLQFMFYGMGSTKMGRFDFASWTLHMAFIIVFSNIWGIVLHEWKGAGKKTMRLIIAGICIVILSTVLIGAGNYFDTRTE
ncbi:MAG: L-rhamnose/proton symporter RhaT [Cytophagaceae bacterium]